MLMLEQVFENRKSKAMKRPVIKSQVMQLVAKGSNGQQFLNDIKR